MTLDRLNKIEARVNTLKPLSKKSSSAIALAPTTGKVEEEIKDTLLTFLVALEEMFGFIEELIDTVKESKQQTSTTPDNRFTWPVNKFTCTTQP